MRNIVLHCPSHATIAARKATRPTTANQKTSTRTVEDALELETQDALVENVDPVMDAKDAATSRNATRQTYCASNAETRGTTPTNAHRENKTSMK